MNNITFVKELFKVLKPKVKNAVYGLTETAIAFHTAPLADKKEMLRSAKKDIEYARKASPMFPDFQALGMYHNLELCKSDVIIFTFTGFRPEFPGIALARGVDGTERIIVNGAFLNLPQAYQEAFLEHEYGHHVLKHLDESKGARMFRHELEADAYSKAQGKDMVGALKAMMEATPLLKYQREMKKRLEALQ